MSASNTTGEDLPVSAAGTLIPLPSAQTLDGFTANGGNTAFTVPETGTYLISYQLDLETPRQITSRVLRNGTELPGSVFAPTGTSDHHAVTQLAALTAGDTLSLQVSDYTGTLELQTGTGAGLTAVRLS